MKTRAPATAFLALCALALVRADQTPPREGAAQTPGRGVIAGVLTNSDSTPAPIRRALITISGSTLAISQVTSTDDAGRFEFVGLPPGRFLIAASRTGYVRDNYGSRQPGGAGSPIALTAGQRVSITMKMTRGAVLAGTVNFPTGAPTSSARLQVLKYGLVSGERRLVPAIGGAYGVDDSGAFRIAGLAPGEYVVMVSAWNSGADEMRLTDLSGAASAPIRRVGYSPVFFPGVVNPADAVAITLAAGEERAELNIPMLFVATSRVVGTIVDPNGRPAQSVQATLVDKMPSPRPAITVRPREDGRFSLSGLSPGRYVLQVRAAPAGATPVAPPAGGRGGPAMPLTLWASQELEVDGRDVSDLDVRLQPGRTIPGRIALAPGSTSGPASFGLFGVGVEHPQGRPGQFLIYALANDDGTFALTGVAPGRFKFRVQLPQNNQAYSNWIPTSAIVGGRDVLDEPLVVTGDRDLTEMTITYSDRVTELSGVLKDAAGQPAPEFVVVAFSVDKKFWTEGSRRVVSVRPAVDGSFRFYGLPPGEYYLSALTRLDTGQLGDASFLDSLVSVSAKVSLGDAEKKRQDLRIGGRP